MWSKIIFETWNVLQTIPTILMCMRQGCRNIQIQQPGTWEIKKRERWGRKKMRLLIQVFLITQSISSLILNTNVYIFCCLLSGFSWFLADTVWSVCIPVQWRYREVCNWYTANQEIKNKWKIWEPLWSINFLFYEICSSSIV